MSTLLKMTWVDSKLFLRNWMASFFTLVFPLLMLFLFGAMYGNEPSALFGGFGGMDVSVPGYIAALIIGTSGFMSLPMELASRREQGVLRRFRASPVHPGILLGSQLLVNVLTSAWGAVLLVIAGVLAFNLRLPENPLMFALGYLVSCVSVFSAGFLLASLLRSASAARAVSMAIFYPMMFLSGGTLPREIMPDYLQRISDFIPLTYVVNLLKGLWFGHGWDLTAVAVLAVICLVCVVVSVRLFRWE